MPVNAISLYRTECYATKKQHEHKIGVTESECQGGCVAIQGWIGDLKAGYLYEIWVALIEEKIREYRLRWFGHILQRSLDAQVRKGVCYQEDDIRRGERPKILIER